MAIEPSINVITGIDPGETTGFAYYERNYDGTDTWIVSKVIDVKKEDIWSYLRDFHDSNRFSGIIVMEQFITNPKAFDKTFQKHFTIQVIGAIKYICHSQGREPVMQMPGDKYPACGRMFGEAYKRKPQHNFDALLHAGWFLLKNKETIKGLNG